MAFGLIPGIICYSTVPYTGSTGSTTTYIRQITIDHTQILGSGFTNFIVFVKLDHSTLQNVNDGGHVANINGNDIKFYDTDFNLLTWDIEYYDSADLYAPGLLCAWVKLPYISSQTDTIFYISYGGKITQNFVGGNPWGSEYVGVYHLGDGMDSTANHLNLMAHNVSAITFTAPTRYGTLFNEHPPVYYKYEGQSSKFNIVSGITLSCWLNIPDGVTNPRNVIMGRWTDSEYGYALLLISNNLYMVVKDSNVPGTNGLFSCIFNNITPYWDQWINIVGTFVPNQGVYLYINGQLAASNEINPISIQNISDVPFYIGTGDNSGNPQYGFNGYIGECKVINTPLSGDQISNEYTNQINPGNIGSAGLMTIGDESGISSGYVFYIDSSTYTPQNSTWYDLSPNGQHVTLIGSPTFDQNDANGAIIFDHAQYGLVPYTSNFNFADGNPFTYETWVKFDNFDNVVIPFSSGVYLANFDWGLEIMNSTTVRFCSSGTASYVLKTIRTLSPGTWYHFAITATLKQANTYYLNIYLNGVKIIVSQEIQMSNFNSGGQIEIAGYGFTGNPLAYGKLVGRLGVCRVYRRYLSDLQIKINFGVEKNRFGY